MNISDNNSFTLIELLVVIAILAILSVAVILVINPADIIKQSRDTNRLTDLNNLNKALGVFLVTNPTDFTGTSTIVYVSLPAASAGTCPGLPALPAGYSYKCVTSSTLIKTDGTGWIPINFDNVSYGSPIQKLPVDPVNSSSTGQYYTYMMGGSWHLTAVIESDRNKMGGSNDRASIDGGSYPDLLEVGTNFNLLPLSRGDSSLLAWWRFEEGTGTSAYDASGSGKTGTLNNSPTWSTDCIQGNCLSFDGNNDYVNFTSFSSSRFTKLAWIKPNLTVCGSLAETRCAIVVNYFEFVVSGGSGYLAYYDYGFNSPGWHNTAGGSITNNQWQQVGVTWDGTALKLYINGVQKTSTNPGGSTNGVNYQLGGVNANNRPFVGSMDSVRIYNRALSTAEILAIYNARN
ncbi:MAG: LamG-like jellyroll fold domain-containing protein [bacterium]|nr:LamG-like jellyroll fold domain-containing protein [bacterium]